MPYQFHSFRLGTFPSLLSVAALAVLGSLQAQVPVPSDISGKPKLLVPSPLPPIVAPDGNPKPEPTPIGIATPPPKTDPAGTSKVKAQTDPFEPTTIKASKPEPTPIGIATPPPTVKTRTAPPAPNAGVKPATLKN